MLVTFRTDSHESITFFGDVAKRLLTMMGHSGTVPGAILAQDVSAALSDLQQALAVQKQLTTAINKDNDADSVVSIAHRALPLISLLQAAVEHKKDVMWS